MSLVISHLTKQYGQQLAVKDISFSIEKGEIVGFLGPNGAGKSTTMKIATTYLPPTEGTVQVNGFDVVKQPMEVRKIIGYLPEHNPLYLDMYVHEYLSFVCGVYGISGTERKQRVAEMIELCGLTKEQNKKIESLSKGYRQRVGLAQALIHNPSVLILDEPTSGLDPNQIIEIRKLIKQISSNKTVILSTHIMQEVEALCDRVIVIRQGEIVADDSLKNLLSQRDGVKILLVEWEGVIAEEDLQAVVGVHSVTQMGKSFRIVTDANENVRAELFRLSAEKKLSLLSLREEESNLEEIFRSLTSSETVA
ncbi:MAG: gliding motility-associated ABC transporter ATP-binding subunit GldA [Cyclobacteriaceae bacterium]|jgi:ABC-2 type transport system ATP-binding protein|nr:gliding motility-associated ABC transporter ATP-binding subunit GldA [Flammeovirgaceae bacterium]